MADKQADDPFALSAGVPEIEGAVRPKPAPADRISKRVLIVAGSVLALILTIVLVSLNEIDNKPKGRTETAKKEAAKEVNRAPDDVTGKSTNKTPGTAGAASAAPQAPSLVSTMSPSDMMAALRKTQEELAGASAGTPAATKPGPAAAASPDGKPAKSLSAASGGDGKGTSATTVPSIGAMAGGSANGGVIPPAGTRSTADLTPGAAAPPRQLSPKEVAEQQAETERANRLRQARAGGLEAKVYDNGTDPAVKPGSSAVEATRAALTDASKQALVAGAMPIAQPGAKKGADSEQDEKLEFLKEGGKDNHNYHAHMPVPPASKNEIKVGTFIPMRLQQGVNSDLPGEITARVSEGVYDTIEGCRLLIPPLTTAVGKYDSKVAIGQTRVLAIWNRLVFPDGSELDLSGMETYDTGGMAGMDSEVDNHYLRMFGVGLGMSLVTATVQVSVPQTTQSGNSVPNYSQQVQAALAQQFGQLGGQIMGKYAAVQPTLRNYYGEAFNIMVPRTIIFSKVWTNRCKRKAVQQTFLSEVNK